MRILFLFIMTFGLGATYADAPGDWSPTDEQFDEFYLPPDQQSVPSQNGSTNITVIINEYNTYGDQYSMPAPPILPPQQVYTYYCYGQGSPMGYWQIWRAQSNGNVLLAWGYNPWEFENARWSLWSSGQCPNR